jgi:hypothetical protein
MHERTVGARTDGSHQRNYFIGEDSSLCVRVYWVFFLLSCLFVRQDQSFEVPGVAPEHTVGSRAVKFLFQRPGTQVIIVDGDIETNWMATLIEGLHSGLRQIHSQLEIVAHRDSLECECTVVRRF